MTWRRTETALYDRVWTGAPGYGDTAPGERYVSVLAEHAQPGATVLDAGTGSGKGALALLRAGFAPTACDLTLTGYQAVGVPAFAHCLWDRLLGQWEWAYCTDVLEHVPTQFTMLAAARLLEAVTHGLLIAVSLEPDQMGVWVGQPLHQTVQSFVWWRDSLAALADARVVDARDLLGAAVFVLAKRGAHV